MWIRVQKWAWNLTRSDWDSNFVVFRAKITKACRSKMLGGRHVTQVFDASFYLNQYFFRRTFRRRWGEGGASVCRRLSPGSGEIQSAGRNSAQRRPPRRQPGSRQNSASQSRSRFVLSLSLSLSLSLLFTLNPLSPSQTPSSPHACQNLEAVSSLKWKVRRDKRKKKGGGTKKGRS